MRGWGRGFVSHPIDLIGVAGRRDFVSQGADLGEGGDVEQCRAGRRVQGDFVSQGVDFVGYLVSKSVESVRDHFVSHRGSNFERCRNLSKWELQSWMGRDDGADFVSHSVDFLASAGMSKSVEGVGGRGGFRFAQR
jgi:hypothetical protein